MAAFSPGLSGLTLFLFSLMLSGLFLAHVALTSGASFPVLSSSTTSTTAAPSTTTPCSTTAVPSTSSTTPSSVGYCTKSKLGFRVYHASQVSLDQLLTHSLQAELKSCSTTSFESSSLSSQSEHTSLQINSFTVRECISTSSWSRSSEDIGCGVFMQGSSRACVGVRGKLLEFSTFQQMWLSKQESDDAAPYGDLERDTLTNIDRACGCCGKFVAKSGFCNTQWRKSGGKCLICAALSLSLSSPTLSLSSPTSAVASSDPVDSITAPDILPLPLSSPTVTMTLSVP